MTDNNVLKVDDHNGRPVLFVYEAFSGVIFHVKPINIPTFAAIQLKAKEKFPYPDPEPYRIPDPEDVAFTPGQASRAEDNPEYQKLCKVIDGERGQWVDRAVFDYCAKMPKYPTHADLVNAFQFELAALREIAVLPEDDYEATLFHIVLTWNQVSSTGKGITDTSSEYHRIIHLAIQTVALTEEEVATGIRFFRPKVSRR